MNPPVSHQADDSPGKVRGAVPRVLVVKLSSLGDLVHALPALDTLHRRLGWTFDWVVKEQYADLVSLFEPVDRVIPFPRRWNRRSAREFLVELRRRYYHLVMDMQGLLRSALIARAARAALTIGPSFHREGSFLFYREIAGKRNKNRHAVEELQDFPRHLGIASPEYRFPIRVPELPPPAAPRPHVILVPGSRWPTKSWPWEKFVPVAAHLIDALRATIFLVGDDRDRQTCETIARELKRPGNVFNRAGETSLQELVVLCATADLMITVDSGPMHLAAALGRPVVALFGPTDAVRTGPFGEGHRVLTAPVTCRPCFRRKCRYGSVPAPCMTGIHPDDVVRAAMDVTRGSGLD
ncbi:MAG: hypothetical protein DRP22_04770 [Verrucomicrobia bacterium]|nr:MAG: hypothetical protein DRP22_04770 [Verrucomicrobiota bacterium]